MRRWLSACVIAAFIFAEHDSLGQKDRSELIRNSEVAENTPALPYLQARNLRVGDNFPTSPDDMLFGERSFLKNIIIFGIENIKNIYFAIPACIKVFSADELRGCGIGTSATDFGLKTIRAFNERYRSSRKISGKKYDFGEVNIIDSGCGSAIYQNI